MKKYTLFLFLFVFLGSCTRNIDVNNTNAPIFGFENKELAIKELGPYAKLFENTNGSIKLEVTQYSNVDQVVGSIFGRYQEELNASRVDGGDFYIDDLHLVYSPSMKQYIPAEGELNQEESYDRIEPLFGDEVTLKIENKDQLIQSDYYIPDLITVQVEGIKNHPMTNAFALKNEDTEIFWNKDLNNANGIVVHLTYDGTQLSSGGQTSPFEKFERAIKFDDTGSGIIPASFFKGIPKDGIFTIYFVRGIVDILENSVTNKTFKFYTLTQDKKNFVLQ